MYKILDNQIPGREFADGEIFKSKPEIVDQLINYHDNDNGIDIMGYFKFKKIKTVSDRLNWLLDWGDWSIIKL